MPAPSLKQPPQTVHPLDFPYIAQAQPVNVAVPPQNHAQMRRSNAGAGREGRAGRNT